MARAGPTHYGRRSTTRAPDLALGPAHWEGRTRFGVCCSGPTLCAGSSSGNKDRSGVDILSEQLSAACRSQETRQRDAIAKRNPRLSVQRTVVGDLRRRARAQSVDRNDSGAASDSCSSASRRTMVCQRHQWTALVAKARTNVRLDVDGAEWWLSHQYFWRVEWTITFAHYCLG